MQDPGEGHVLASMVASAFVPVAVFDGTPAWVALHAGAAGVAAPAVTDPNAPADNATMAATAGRVSASARRRPINASPGVTPRGSIPSAAAPCWPGLT